MAYYFFTPRDMPTETAPSGTTDRWVATSYANSVTTYRDGGFQDRCLEVTQNGTTGRYLRSIDAVDADANRNNANVLCSFRTVADAFLAIYSDARIIVRGSGAAASETCYMFIARQGTGILVYKFVAGTATQISTTVTKTITEGLTYWMRVRASGTTLQCRIWSDGDDEPTTWDFNQTDSAVTAAGWIGYAHANVTGTTGYTQFDFVSIGTNGDTALTPISRTAFEAWLAQDGAQRCLLAHLGMMDTATPTTRYLANMRYASGDYDTPADTLYDEAIVGVPGYSATAGEILIGRTTIGVGALILENADGSRDAWCRANSDGQECSIFIGDPAWPQYDFRYVLRAYVENIVSDGEERIRVDLHDAQRLANNAVATDTIGSGDNAGRMIPVLLGTPQWIEPVALDNATLEYQIHDGAVATVGDAYDGGIALTASGTVSSFNTSTEVITMTATHGLLAGYEIVFATTAGGVTAGQIYYVLSSGLTSTECKITATYGSSTPVNLTGASTSTWTAKGRAVDYATGKLYLASTPVFDIRIDSASATDAVLPQAVMKEALEYMGLTGYLDDASFDDYWMASATCGVYVTDRTNALTICDDMARSGHFIYGGSRDGLIYIALALGQYTPVSRLTLTADDILGGIAIERIRPPAATIFMRYGRNWQPTRQFADAVDPTARTLYQEDYGYRSTASAISADSLANHAGAIDQEEYDDVNSTSLPASLTQLTYLRGTKTAVARFATTLRALDLRVGDGVTVQYPRYGLTSGVVCQVIGIADALSEQQIGLTVLIPNFYQVAAP